MFKLFLKLPENKNLCGLIILIFWLIVSGILCFVTGEILRSILLFLLGYNVIYPLFTVFVSFALAKYRGISLAFCLGAILAAALSFAFTDLMRYAMPNVIVVTVIAVFFASGIGNIFGDNDKSDKTAKAKKVNNKKGGYKNILDD